MVNYFKSAVVLCFLMLAACQEGREAGDLLGQWRLNDSDTKYISFSGSVTLFRLLPEGQVFGKFQHDGDSLFIQCIAIEDSQKEMSIVENSFGFRPFSDIRLKIENLSDDQLVLSKGHKTWAFYKY